MTTATTQAPIQRSSHATLSRLMFGGILRSEWIKLRSLRSTYWCYALIIVINIGLSALIAYQNLNSDTQGPGSRIAATDNAAEALTIITVGLALSALISAVLGALSMTGEYGTGMIKSTFTADPKRLGAVFAKVLVFGVTTFVVGLVSLVAAALVAAPGLSTNKISFDWSDGHVWLALIGGAGYLALVGLIAFGLGALVRSSAGGIAAGIGLLFVVPIVVQIITGVTNLKWVANINEFLPSAAGGKIYAYGSGTSKVTDGLITLDATQGLLVLVGWVVVLVGIAAVVVKRRDA